MAFPKILNLPKTWTLLSTLIGDDYSATNGYIIHVDNMTKELAEVPILRATLQSTTPAETYRGSEYPAFVDIETDPGDSLWVKSGSNGVYTETIEVYEVVPSNTVVEEDNDDDTEGAGE